MPAPDVGASTDHAHAALPAERLVVGGGVRLLDVVREPVVVPLAARVAVALLRPRLANQFARLVAVFQLERRNVLGEVVVALRLSRFEQRDLDAGFGEPLGGPSTRGARADHDHIELDVRFSARLYPECPSGWVQPGNSVWKTLSVQPSSRAPFSDEK